MPITIDLPADIERELRRHVPNLDQHAREQFLLANYQAGNLSTGDLAEILDLKTRHEAQTWLAQHGVPLNYTQADLDQDRRNLAQLFPE